MPKQAIGYMSYGYRRYGEFPARAQQRKFWEIQCVFKGGAHPCPSSFDHGSSKTPALYIFEPMHHHGWAAPPRDLSEILVVHVRRPSRIFNDLDLGGAAMFPLTEVDLLRVKTLFEWMHPHWVDAIPASSEVLESGAVLLADLVRQKLLAPSRAAFNGTPRTGALLRRVEHARSYYRGNILRNPQVEEVARAVGVSSSQLRRIFVAAGQPPPGMVFRAIQMDYARRLLAATCRSVSEISDELGFDSPSAFSRSFKGHFGKSPLHFCGLGPDRNGNF